MDQAGRGVRFRGHGDALVLTEFAGGLGMGRERWEGQEQRNAFDLSAGEGRRRKVPRRVRDPCLSSHRACY